MSLIGKIDALLKGIRREDVESLPPAQRQRLAQELRAIADMAEPPYKAPAPRSGVLSHLDQGERAP